MRAVDEGERRLEAGDFRSRSHGRLVRQIAQRVGGCACRSRPFIGQVVNVIVPESLATPAVPAACTDPLRLPLAPVKTPVPPTITSVSVPEAG